jgi:hypothetical protein
MVPAPYRDEAWSWAAIGAVVGVTAALDVRLLRRGRLAMSTVVRRSRVLRVLWLGLTAHLLAELRYDPLAMLGKRLTARPPTLPPPPDLGEKT